MRRNFLTVMQRFFNPATTASALLWAAMFFMSAKQAPAQDAAGKSFPEVKTVMASMRDGVRLATDVQVPEGKPGPFSAILLRTPYKRDLLGAMGIIRGFISDNYVLVSQDTRGRFDSEGSNIAFITDQEDGYDTVKWIAGQPWSDGKVVMVGASALGITGYQAAIAAPEELKCVVSGVAPADLFGEAIFWDGEIRKDLAYGWTVGTKYPVENLQYMTEHPYYDEFAQRYDLSRNASRVQTPMFHFGGWFDIFSEGTLHSFNALQTGGGAGARGRQRLIMGPWTHAGAMGPKQGDLKFPANSVILPMVKDLLGWVDECFNGGPDADSMPVNYYLMGDVDQHSSKWNVWKKSAVWPPAHETRAWELHPDGLMRNGETGGDEKGMSFTFDPSNPVPTRGGGNLTIGSHGPVDQREVENRPDVLLFETAPFDEPYAIAGPVYADLAVTTDGCDTDFTAKITDVYPDGRSMLILDGIQRAGFREGDASFAPVPSGQKFRMKIYVGDTAHAINKGHKLRLAVSSSNHPRFSVNPNTCPDPLFPKETVKAEYDSVKADVWAPTHEGVEYKTVRNTVFTGGSDGSRLLLPKIDL